MAFKATIPTRSEMARAGLGTDQGVGIITLSDFCKAQSGNFSEKVWLRTGHCEKTGLNGLLSTGANMVSTLNLREPDWESYSAPDDDGVGVLPMLINPAEEGFGVTEVGGEKLLTHNNRICLYPQSKSDEAASAILDDDTNILEPAGEVRHVMKTAPALSGSYNFESESRAFRIGDAIHLQYETKKGTQNFVFEPIRVSTLSDGNIIFNTAIGKSFYDNDKKFQKYCKEKKIHHGDELNTADTVISHTLRMFIDDIRVIALSLGKPSRDIGPIGDAAALLSRLKPGDTVKIKCEGRTGIVKALDQTTATLNVSGKALKYRYEDLAEPDR